MSIRVQIARKPTTVSIDGVQVDGLEVGRIYELGTHIATVLMAEGWAVPMPMDETVPHVPFSEADPCAAPVYRDKDAPPNLTREHYHLDVARSRAADMQRRQRGKRKKR